MPQFLTDEDMPRSLARFLTESNVDTLDVRDAGLRGQSDEAILAYAKTNQRTIITADVEFGNILRFALGTHPGIIVARFPVQIPIREVNAAILAAIQSLSESDLAGNVVTITPTQIRIRRHS